MSNPEPTELRERREGWMLADLVFFPLKPFNNHKLWGGNPKGQWVLTHRWGNWCCGTQQSTPSPSRCSWFYCVSPSVMPNSLQLHGLQLTRLLCGILQARVLKWVASSSSRGSSWPGSSALQADSLPSEPPGKPSRCSGGAFCPPVNGNPLQCSCLENPRDGGAWWAAVYGFAQSWTRLKRLSSSSSQGHGQLGMCYWEVTGLLSAVTGLQCWDYRFQQLDWGQDSHRDFVTADLGEIITANLREGVHYSIFIQSKSVHCPQLPSCHSTYFYSIEVPFMMQHKILSSLCSIKQFRINSHRTKCVIFSIDS